MNIAKLKLTKWSSTNTPSGRHPNSEFTQLGRCITDPVGRRQYEFCQISLSGVSARAGEPVVLVSAAKVSPDVSDATSAQHESQVFAGILATSTTISPDSGSTAYGWVMKCGYLGKRPGSLVGNYQVKTYAVVEAVSVAAGKPFHLSAGDGVFIAQSGQASADFKFQKANFIAFADTVATSTETSVKAGCITSYV